MSESSLTEIRRTSRFKLLDRPMAIPGKCVICGAVDRPVVDINWSIDYYGVVYFCISCLTEVATVIGMVDGKLLEDAELDSTRQFYKYLAKHELRVISNGQYDSWVNAVSNLHVDILNGEHSQYGVLDESSTQTESATDEIVSGTVEQESKPIIDEGPISLSASSSDGKPFDFS
jgi:hypothetical protein